MTSGGEGGRRSTPVSGILHSAADSRTLVLGECETNRSSPAISAAKLSWATSRRQAIDRRTSDELFETALGRALGHRNLRNRASNAWPSVSDGYVRRPADQLVAQTAVRERPRARLGKVLGIIGDQQMPASHDREALGSQRGTHDGPAMAERLQDLQSGSAAGTQRSNGDARGLIEGPDTAPGDTRRSRRRLRLRRCRPPERVGSAWA